MIQQSRIRCKIPEFLAKEARPIQKLDKPLIKKGLPAASGITNEGRTVAPLNRNPQVMRLTFFQKVEEDQ